VVGLVLLLLGVVVPDFDVVNGGTTIVCPPGPMMVVGVGKLLLDDDAFPLPA
jgi:hypothetical protein